MSETVCCNEEIMKKCYYSAGSSKGNPYMITHCEYILIEGKRRGCNPEKCTKFKDKNSVKTKKPEHIWSKDDDICFN